MSIADLGSIGEFLGSFAVLVTLGYLAVQTRAARQATEFQTLMALNNMHSTGIGGIISTKPDALEILSKGNSGEPLDDDELNAYALMHNSLLINPYASILHAGPSPTRTRTLSGFDRLIKANWQNPNFVALWDAGFWSYLSEEQQNAIESHRGL